jgi:uncharacterized protein (DUF488 family)
LGVIYYFTDFWTAAPGRSYNGAVVLYSIGHSTRTIEEFAALLAARGVRRLADIRTVPKSRHVPQFNSEPMKASMARSGIDYEHLPELGGLRKPRPDSKNLGWKNKSFRGYADYMETAEFEEGLQRLLAEASDGPLVYMCAEAVPWRCHRNLVSDVLVARGHVVLHIIGAGEPHAHKLTPFAVVRDQKVTYPGDESEQGGLWEP